MKLKQRGGKRREGQTKTMCSYRIDNDLLEVLKSLPNTSKFINEAIRENLLTTP